MLASSLSQAILPKDLKLIRTRTFKSGHIWEVEKVRQEFEICPKCATPSSFLYGRCTSTVRDEPLRQKGLWLKIHKHRYYCKTCRKPFTEPVSIIWPKRRTTQRFRKFIGSMCENMVDLKRVRTMFGVSTGFMYEVYYSQIQIKLRERQGKPWPTVVGIDEHFFRRIKGGGTEFVTMLTDVKKRKLFDVALGKNSQTLFEQLEAIPGRENVQTVVMDLSSGYRALAKKLFPNAQIVADKFHVVRLLSPVIMKFGRNIHGHRQNLKVRRRLLCRRDQFKYSERQEIDHYLKDHPALDAVYRVKEQIHTLYETKGHGRASKALVRMIEALKASPIEELKRFGRTLKTWSTQILLYFQRTYTNAITECLNNRGKLVQKRGYGYRSFKNYRLRLLSACLF